MKNVIKLTLAVVLMMGASSLYAQKMGRVNTQEIIVAMPETKVMQTNLEAYGKDLQDNMETISVEFNNKFQDFNKNMSNYSDAVRQLKEKELRELQGRSEEFQQIAQQEYQKKQQELLAPIIEKAKAAIDKVSIANAFVVVFDISTGSLAYFNEETLIDIAPMVKKELGIVDAPAAVPAK